MQFFLVLPFILYIYSKNKKFGYFSVLGLLIGNIVTTLIIGFWKKVGVNLVSDGGMAGLYIYYKPWTRCGTYLVGIFFGMLFWEFKNVQKFDLGNSFGFIFYSKVFNSWVFRHILFFTGLFMTTFIVYLPMKDIQHIVVWYWPVWAGAFYQAFSRPFFIIGLALILSGSMVGKHSFVRYFLAGEFWARWAKLTFVAYIIHILVFFYYYGSAWIATPFEHTPILWIFFATVIITYMLSVPVSLLCEAPFLHLEKFFIFKERSEKFYSKISEA